MIIIFGAPIIAAPKKLLECVRCHVLTELCSFGPYPLRFQSGLGYRPRNTRKYSIIIYETASETKTIETFQRCAPPASTCISPPSADAIPF